MTLADLIRRFRVLACDTAHPPLWKDCDLADWFSDAQDQAAIRGRLLLEDANDEVCSLTIAAGTHTYTLHRSLYELVDLWIAPAVGERACPVVLRSREWLDHHVCDWRYRDRMPGGTIYALQGDTTLRIVPTPTQPGTLRIEGYRLPLKRLVEGRDTPEIHEAHHEHLIHWVLHRAYGIPDTETFDAQRSAAGERAFTAYFGPLPDSDLRRATRQDNPHTNAVFC
ncbi:hypothetical protein C8245_22935 [Paracidovorax avenae]|uniref:phage adaptor protein n=1 Tax=Paracidovorax avenae TaxID=80867 RepID=UPI000D229CF3|nr:DUF6682 family protein [Paracidovorax avenae]AVS68136.1 hypothetical protein C8245_22935 [Paracidovorax avenae]